VNCVVCEGPLAPLFVKGAYTILACGACGHQMAELSDASDHVARTYSDTYFFGGGAGYQDYLGEAKLLRSAGRRYGGILGRHTEPGRILDVGAAAGFVLQGYRDCGWDGVALEPNATMAQHARDELGLTVANCALEDFEPDRQFDAVSLVQVIGHFQQPQKALASCSALLLDGGYVLIETWDRLSWTARLFGQNWQEYSPPSVLHWFSIEGLCSMSKAAGLSYVAHGRPLKKIGGAHAKSLLLHKIENRFVQSLVGTAVRVIPDSMAIWYPFDDVKWVLLRKTES